MTRRLTRNAIRCRKCDTVIESKHRHDLRWCPCKSVFVDGGLEYERAGGELADIEWLSEYEEVPD